jgi:hypothetical protein
MNMKNFIRKAGGFVLAAVTLAGVPLFSDTSTNTAQAQQNLSDQILPERTVSDDSGKPRKSRLA